MVGCRRSAELEFVGSSLPEVAKPFTSSLIDYSAAPIVLGSRDTGGTTLLVIQSSLFDIKLINS